MTSSSPSTSDLIFSVGEIIFQLSQAMAFEPGDVILIGTPQGVALSGKYPYLADGDVVELELEGARPTLPGRDRHGVNARSGAPMTGAPLVCGSASQW